MTPDKPADEALPLSEKIREIGRFEIPLIPKASEFISRARSPWWRAITRLLPNNRAANPAEEVSDALKTFHKSTRALAIYHDQEHILAHDHQRDRCAARLESREAWEALGEFRKYRAEYESAYKAVADAFEKLTGAVKKWADPNRPSPLSQEMEATVSTGKALLEQNEVSIRRAHAADRAIRDTLMQRSARPTHMPDTRPQNSRKASLSSRDSIEIGNAPVLREIDEVLEDIKRFEETSYRRDQAYRILTGTVPPGTAPLVLTKAAPREVAPALMEAAPPSHSTVSPVFQDDPLLARRRSDSDRPRMLTPTASSQQSPLQHQHQQQHLI